MGALQTSQLVLPLMRDHFSAHWRWRIATSPLHLQMVQHAAQVKSASKTGQDDIIGQHEP
jgi:hypothetical protein